MLRSVLRGVIGAAIAAVVTFLVWLEFGPDPAPSPSKHATSEAPEPDARPEREAEPGQDLALAAPETPAEAAAADPARDAADPAREAAPAPSFDVVRIAPDGQAVIAGRAGPGETVEILLDGQVIGRAETDAAGAFATVLEIPPAPAARELMLRATRPQGEQPDVALGPAETTTTDPDATPDATPGAPPGDAAAGPTPALALTEPAAGPAPDGMTPPAASATTSATTPAAGAQPAGERSGPSGLAALPPEAAGLPAALPRAGAGAADPAPAPTATARGAIVQVPASSPGVAPSGSEPPVSGTEATALVRTLAAPGEAAAPGPASAAPPPAGSVYALSAPVVILPGAATDQAPAVVRPEAEAVALLQPTVAVSGAGIVLDRITYEDAGAIVAAGRGRPGAVIRIYANAEFLAETRSDAEGVWQARIARRIAADTLLLRFDQVGEDGQVVGRLETPFEYAPEAVAHELRQRRIVVQRGDYLWKFAEQHYGRGIRYSVIYQANAHLIRDPDLIYPGQVFTVPELVDSR